MAKGPERALPASADDVVQATVARSDGDERYTASGRLRKKLYERELARLQEELVKLQYWVQDLVSRF